MRNPVKKWAKAPVERDPKHRCELRATKLTPYHEQLHQALAADAKRPKRERRTARALHAQIKTAGCTGAYTRVTNFIRAWGQEQARAWRRVRSCRWLAGVN